MLDSTFIIYIVKIVESLFLVYFLALNGTYLLMTIVSLGVLPYYIQRQSVHKLPHPQTGFEPPITLIVTAFNEEAVIVPSVRALLQLEYHEYEILIVNDGSTDKSIEIMTAEFDLEVIPIAFRQRIKHKPVKQVFQSRKYPNLRVIDKINGGSKADASNAGINGARYGLFMPLDADTILERDCLRYLIQPFLLNPETIGVGGNVRILNGCKVDGGMLSAIDLPKTWLGLFQVLEYTRAFLSGRVGWNFFNALPLISGAFGLFNKEAVISVGGYSHKSLGEDMDLVLRLHRYFRIENPRPYRLDFCVDAACWTEAPETFKVLKKQRVRWQRGLFDCLWENRKLLFHPKSGLIGWGSFPFLLFLEGISPLVEVVGLLFFLVGYSFGVLNPDGAMSIMFLSFGMGFLLSISSILLEEVAFQTYPQKKHLWILFLGALAENFGFHQLMSIWRLEGIIKWIVRADASWGAMTRNTSWQAAPASTPTPNLSQLQDKKEDSNVKSKEKVTT